MNSTRAAAVGGSLAATLVIAACGSADQPAAQRAARGPATVVTGGALAVDRLHRPLDAPVAISTSTRNPFKFGGGAPAAGRGLTPSTLAPLPPPDGLPVLPLPLAPPPLRLLGFVTFADGAKVAVVVVGRDLVMARAGDMLAGRFRVGRITEDAVDMTDAVGERPFRLALP